MLGEVLFLLSFDLLRNFVTVSEGGIEPARAGGPIISSPRQESPLLYLV
jgi:hypothetical protein